MSRISRFSALAAAGAAAALVLAGCANTAESDGDAGAEGSSTVTPGTLTIATGEPAYAPWVLNDDPESGEGFEAAVAYAVAEQLGYAAEDVTWVRTTFEAAIAPGAKDWDFNIQQFSITDERREAVDFSSPYYVTTQTVVAAKGSPAEHASSIEDLKDVVIGVAAGTTALPVAEEVIAPNTDIQVFNTNDDAVAALQNGTIDVLVTDLPSAYYVRDAQLEGNGVIVGQLPSDERGDELGLVLPKGSALTDEVTAAVDALREDGTLAELETTWLAEQDAPILQ